ncbi:MAG: cytidylate kinase-like family protein [Anaerolineae bacterium]
MAELDEAQSVAFVQSTIQAAYQRGNMVIVGRGGQAILKGKPDVLHVRIEAPLDVRNHRVHEQEKVSLAAAQDIVIKHDRVAADYLKRFHDVDWADSRLYDLVINTDKLGVEGTVSLIAQAVGYLQPATVAS